MVRVVCQEMLAKTALNRCRPPFPLSWSLNPYRGCAHGCRYCYARPFHAYLDLDPDTDFESVVLAKTNLAEVLRREIDRPSWRRERIGIGSAADPYQPAEAQHRVTRQCLELLAERGNPCSVTTKGTLVVRDLDVLGDLARRAETHVLVSLIALDDAVRREFEPGAPPPASRLRAIERLRLAGVPVSVLAMPVLPGLTDRPDQVRDLVHAVAEHGAGAIHHCALRLAPGIRDRFVAFVAGSRPSLAATYARAYARRADAPSDYRQRLAERFAAARATTRFQPPPEAPAVPMTGQLPLPL